MAIPVSQEGSEVLVDDNETGAEDRFPRSHVNLGSLCIASPCTQSSIWDPAASMPAASVLSTHSKMGEGSWLWPTVSSRK